MLKVAPVKGPERTWRVDQLRSAFRLEAELMSAPAKQPRNVDLMRDDPERLLDVSEAAALLHVKKIPYIASFARLFDFIAAS